MMPQPWAFPDSALLWTAGHTRSALAAYQGRMTPTAVRYVGALLGTPWAWGVA